MMTLCFLLKKKKLMFEALKFHLKQSYDKQSLLLMIISNEMTNVRSSIHGGMRKIFPNF